MKKLSSRMIITLITSFIHHPPKMSIVLSLVMAFTFCSGMLTLSAQGWTQIGSDVDGEAVGDRSGTSVSLSKSGTRLAIGSPSQGYAVSGHVRVFSESNGSWSQMGGNIVGEASHDLFGNSVSISGNGLRLAIGAPWNGGSAFHAGHVRMYKESGGAWTKVGSDIDGEAPDDWSGSSVSTSFDGKRVAIGAHRNDGNGADAGHVRVYKQTGNNWIQVGSDIDGAAADNFFGLSVSLNGAGNIVAIGAPRNDDNGIDAGHVRVYIESNGTWIQYGGDIGGEFPDDHSGRTVSLSENGNVVAIGAIWNDGGGADAGHVRVFTLSEGTWVQQGSDIDGAAPGDWFGGDAISLSPDGEHLAVGAQYNDGGGSDAGHVRVFSYSASSGEWLQVANAIPGEASFDWSGSSVSLANNTGLRVAIGAVFNDGNGTSSGHVRVYDETPCDADLDGYDNIACGGSDCNDNDASINPGATEVCNGIDDNCDTIVDEGTDDTDGDGVCDGLDNCLAIANADQANDDGDDLGDACDACPNDPENDADSDDICGDLDNCPSSANSGQEDSDCDGVGDACDLCPDGDDSVDNNNDGIADCSQLLNYSLYCSDWKCGNNKINICHSGTTTCISKNQLSTHYNHGDNIGPCVSCGGQNFNMPDGPLADLDEPDQSWVTMAELDDHNDIRLATEEGELILYPNPATNHIQIQYEGAVHEIRLISAQGAVVRAFETEEDLREISLEELPSGLYLMMIRSGEKWMTKKIIKL